MTCNFLRQTALLCAALPAFVFAIGTYDYSDNVPWSQNPPGGLAPEQVPQFVTIGFDDNGYSGLSRSLNPGGGMTFVTDSLFADKINQPGSGNTATFDGTPATCSFYFSSYYGGGTWQAESPVVVKCAWNRAFTLGHDCGNHTDRHADGTAYSLDIWKTEMITCNSWLTKPLQDTMVKPAYEIDQNCGAAIPAGSITGFRTPFLKYNNETFTALKEIGFTYDCSIEEGYQAGQDGSNFCWPYTLDSGSPGHAALKAAGAKSFDVTNHPGLWELSCHPVIIPPDDKCEQYGVQSGLREKISLNVKEGNKTEILASGKITGLDYNLWYDAKITRAEFVAILKYTLDIRLAGNRAPLLFGAHSDEYATSWVGEGVATAKCPDRHAALKEFIDYALSKPEVRVVGYNKVIEWCRNPAPLTGTSTIAHVNKAAAPIIVHGSTIQLPGAGTVRVFDMRGKQIAAETVATPTSWNCASILPAGSYSVTFGATSARMIIGH